MLKHSTLTYRSVHYYHSALTSRSDPIETQLDGILFEALGWVVKYLIEIKGLHCLVCRYSRALY